MKRKRISYKNKRKIGWLIIIIATIIGVLYGVRSYVTDPYRKAEQLRYSEFMDMAKDGGIERLEYNSREMDMFAHTYNSEMFKVNNPMYDDFRKDMLELGIEVVSKENSGKVSGVFFVYASIMVFLLLIALAIRSSKNMSNNMPIGNGSDSLMGTGQINLSPERKETKNTSNKMFSDVAGLYEVKNDLRYLVDFIVNKDKYIEAGAKLPRGVILYGPPGTGKTLLAKAMANESNVKFIYMSGSDFIEMYVGVGASRIRELFKRARREAPSIIFIDEIDSIGCKRDGKSNGEDRKTINALLTEMDGFEESDNILVIGATNRIEDLDPALLREGRFTEKFCVPIPETVSERKEILELYTKNKRLGEDVDLEALAHETTGFSPAKIEALLNESAIISVQKGLGYITKTIIDEAMYKTLLHGHMRKSNKERSKKELELVAWHEAGHALVGVLNGTDITKVTILSSTSGAGGVTFRNPSNNRLNTVEDLKMEVMELYGGRVAELLLYDDPGMVTTGASNDIERATELIHSMVVKYGMSQEFGLINLEKAGFDKEYILEKEAELSKELVERTKDMLVENKGKLELIAKALLKNETIYASDLNSIIGIAEKERACS